MENIVIKLDAAEAFDAVLRDSLREGGDLKIITKDNATEGGQPAVMVTFTVQMPDGSMQTVQAVTTLKLFAGVSAALRGKYPEYFV